MHFQKERRKLIVSSGDYTFINTYSKTKLNKFTVIQEKICREHTKFLWGCLLKNPNTTLYLCHDFNFQIIVQVGKYWKGKEKMQSLNMWRMVTDFFPFYLYKCNYICAKTKKMQKKGIFFFLLHKNFHIHCIPRDINPSSPIVVDVNHLSIWKHFSSSHTVIASSASTPSEAGYRFRGHDNKLNRADIAQHSLQHLLFLSLSIQKQRNHSKLASCKV